MIPLCISDRDSAHDICVAIVAVLTGEMAAMCQHNVHNSIHLPLVRT